MEHWELLHLIMGFLYQANNVQVSTLWMSLYAAKLKIITQICCLEMHASHNHSPQYFNLNSVSNIHSAPRQNCCTCRFWLLFSNKHATICSSDLMSYLTLKMHSVYHPHAANKLRHQSAGRVTIKSNVIQLCVAMPQTEVKGNWSLFNIDRP